MGFRIWWVFMVSSLHVWIPAANPESKEPGVIIWQKLRMWPLRWVFPFYDSISTLQNWGIYAWWNNLNNNTFGIWKPSIKLFHTTYFICKMMPWYLYIPWASYSKIWKHKMIYMILETNGERREKKYL